MISIAEFRAVLGEPGHDHALVPQAAPEWKDARIHEQPLASISPCSAFRTSAKGNALPERTGLRASHDHVRRQPDKHGNATWDVFLSQPEPRDGTRGHARARQCMRRQAGALTYPRRPTAVLALHKAPRPESATRLGQERISAEMARRYGVQRDEDLNDAIQF